MNNYLSKIISTFDKQDTNKILVIFFLTLICSIFELMGIGLIIPLLHIFAGDQIHSNIPFLSNIFDGDLKNILFIILACFLILYFAKFYLNKTLIKLQNTFSHNLFAKTSKKFFNLYLNKDYDFFVQNNSANLIRNILSECNLFSMGVVFYLVQLTSELIIFIFICTFLLIYNFKISLLVIFTFAFFGGILFKKNAENLRLWGKKRQYHSAIALKQLQQSFGSFRELLMNKLVEVFHRNYSYHTDENAKFGIKRDTVTQMPRLILEILAVSILIFIVYVLTYQGKTLAEVLVLLGVFFYSTIRLLPSISKIVKAIQNLKYNYVVVDLVCDGLNEYKKTLNKKNITTDFKKLEDFEKIVLENVDFSYSNEKKIFNKLNLEIKKGDKLGIIGKTGSGKSTFINILCGLLNINYGKIYYDNYESQKNYTSIQSIIGYVPQTVSIFDESILFNICLTNKLSDDNFKRLHQVLDVVDLNHLVNNFPNKHNEIVGENGSKLSGGQNQRIGIARAIFRNPKILILDEATNALDIPTEQKIIKNLLNHFPQLTLISISHRPTSLNYCDKIIETKDYNLIEIKR